MSYSVDLLDRAKVKLGSDYKAAKVAGVSRQFVSQVRSGRGHFNGAHAARLAELLGENPINAALRVEADRVQSDEDRRYLKRLGGLAASVILSLNLFTVSPDVSAGYKASVIDTAIHYDHKRDRYFISMQNACFQGGFMYTKDINNLEWFWIGLKVGFGFSIASGVIGVLLFICFELYMSYQIQAAFAPIIEAVAATPSSASAAAKKPRRVKKVRTVHGKVPAKSSSDCLLITDGIINEQYQRCTTGYATSWKEEYWVWE